MNPFQQLYVLLLPQQKSKVAIELDEVNNKYLENINYEFFPIIQSFDKPIKHLVFWVPTMFQGAIVGAGIVVVNKTNTVLSCTLQSSEGSKPQQNKQVYKTISDSNKCYEDNKRG